MKTLFFILALFVLPFAKEVSGVGVVKAYYRSGNIFTGMPTMAYIECIADGTYAYYIIPDLTTSLLRSIDKTIIFNGKAYKDSTTLKDGGLPHWFINLKDFAFKK